MTSRKKEEGEIVLHYDKNSSERKGDQVVVGGGFGKRGKTFRKKNKRAWETIPRDSQTEKTNKSRHGPTFRPGGGWKKGGVKSSLVPRWKVREHLVYGFSAKKC